MKADPTEKLALGRTGLAISRICFGMAPIGDMPDTYGYSVEPERARETVRAVFDSPVNFLDTSRNYGLGRRPNDLSIGGRARCPALSLEGYLPTGLPF